MIGKDKNTLDFTKHKNSLKHYLKLKGFNSSNNPMFCFSHSHNNTNTPACAIYDDNFKCQSCGIHGDIYDACEILTGITEKAEQFKEVEKTLLGYIPELEKKKEKFKIDKNAFKKLINYLKNHGGRNKGVMSFLKQRGYTDELIKKMISYFCYWPGFDIAIKEIGKETLKKSGIPLINPEKNYSSWFHSGIVVRLSKGLKLCYYNNYICEKRGSKSCYTFPGPWKIENDKTIILVEAEITAIAMRALGYNNVIPSGGTNGITIKSLKKYLLSTKEIIFAFDGDEPGRKASCIIQQQKDDKNKKKLYPDLLIKNGYNGIIKIAHLPDDKDPDDLIRENKIEELKKIIDNAIIYKSEKNKNIEETNNYPFFFLGYDNRAHYILPKNQNIALRIGRGDTTIKNWLKEMAPFSWWLKTFQKEDSDGLVSFDQLTAIEWFRNKSYNKGIYDDEKILGIGVHQDNEKIVFNAGNHLIIENKKIDYNNYTGKNIYCRSKIILDLKGPAWAINDGLNLVKQLKTFSFERSIDYIVICGFIALAPFASILEIRPHIWLTSQKGTGKTTILRKIIVPAVGEKQALFKEALISEAYIRQKCSKDCRIVILDEFEAHNKESLDKQRKILELIRSAYSGTGGGKGTPDHRPIDFNFKLMFCLASINIRFDNDADRTRIVVCRLKPKNDKNFVKKINNFYGLRFRIFQRITYVNQYIEKAKEIIIEKGHNNRTADTYAPFLVGFWMIISDHHFFENDYRIQEYLLKMIDTINEIDYEDDEDRILSCIFQYRIKIDPGTEFTIAEMLTKKEINTQTANYELIYDSYLRRYGIRRCISKDKEILAIDMNNAEIKKILRDTPFSEYKEILQRHKLVIERSKVIYMSAKNTRCIILDWKKLEEKYFKEKFNNDLPF